MARPSRSKISRDSLIRLGIKAEFHNKSLADFDLSGPRSVLADVVEYVRDYIANLDYNFENNLGILFCGNNGVGKSMLASLILKEAYVKRYSVNRVLYNDYCNAYTRSWSARGEEKESLEELFYADYKAVEFLALEEIGKEIRGDSSGKMLEDLLRFREERGLPTIICTNMRHKEIVERYGQSVSSLIQGNCTPIVMSVTEDYRSIAFKKRKGG